MNNDNQLSIVILTHNSEKLITHVVRSCLFASEVIIMDDFSTDKTIDLLRNLPVKVYKHKLSNNFCEQRNLALKKTSGKWVFYVDSDEIVSSKLRREILVGIQENTFSGYKLRRRDFFLGRQLENGENGRNLFLRLAKRDAGVWIRPVHETWKVNGKIGTLSEPIDHYFNYSITDFITKLNTYTSIEASLRKDKGESFRVLNVIVFPLGKFVHNFFVKQGFKDGLPGLIMTWMMSFHSLLVRIKLYEQP